MNQPSDSPYRIYGEYGGSIGRTHAESTPWWPTPPHPGDDAPNVIVILLDDLGFAQLGCFGGEVPTPNIDRLAERGVRFTNFHVTPVCSPTRAALLTGRHPHEVGMRSVSNFNTGYPNMRGEVSKHASTMGEVLRAAGYTTFAVGKWHLTQMENASAAGPYDQWPCQRGFDRYYGFLDGEADQFAPELVYDNHAVDPPRTAAEGYHLSEDLVDRTLGFIHDTVSLRPDRPFFTYLAFGATHAPHQAPAEYLAKYRGRFDDGWDAARQRIFDRQLALGVIPEGTQLAPRNPGVEPWDTLGENQRRLAARLQEAFAAFLDHTDAQIGRLLDGLEALGVAEDTAIILLSDNGASQEGGPFGVLHEMKFFNFILETPDEAVHRLDDIGGPSSHANYPWGWAQAGNTPFKWYKQNTHEGGVHVPLIVHWPGRIGDPGSIRRQYHYVTDIAPTVYEIIGCPVPETLNGYEQMPITGTSMAYCLGDGTAPDAKVVQHFEQMGHRALYLDGWKAVTRHQPGVAFDDDVWELYHVAVDPSECDDRAAAEPERMAAMIERWWFEAERHGVLPLDDRTVQLFGARFRDRSPHTEARRYRYRPPMTRIPVQVAAQLAGRSWDLDAVIDRPAGAGGVLYATGNENSGLVLFIDGDHLVFDYNCFGDHHEISSTVPVPTGASRVGVRFRRSAARGDTTGVATLVVDEQPVGEMTVPFVMRMITSAGASVGHDHGSPVSTRYTGGFPFEGRLEVVEIQLVDHRVSDADRAAQLAAEERSAMGRQ